MRNSLRRSVSSGLHHGFDQRVMRLAGTEAVIAALMNWRVAFVHCSSHRCGRGSGISHRDVEIFVMSKSFQFGASLERVVGGALK